MGRNRLFDWDGVVERATGMPDSTLLLSATTYTLALDALAVMLDRWRWQAGMSDTDWNETESAISQAIQELIVYAPIAAFIDEFDRSDGPLGDGWATSDFLDLGIAVMVIDSERAIAASNTEHGAFYEGQQFGPDVEFITELVVGAADSIFWYIRLVDAFTPGITGYRVWYEAASDLLRLHRVEANTTNVLLASESLSVIATGDIVKITAIDDEISVYVNDVLVLQHADTTPLLQAGNVAFLVSTNTMAIERMEARTL